MEHPHIKYHQNEQPNARATEKKFESAENQHQEHGIPIKSMAYQSLVRLQIEYAAVVWDPHTLALTRQVEMIRRRAARYATQRYHNISSVSSMLQDMSWKIPNKLQTIGTKSDPYRFSCFPRSIRDWNCLPSRVVIAETVSQFKTELAKVSAH